ncbi:TROVE domain-containing protein [Nocardia transvalensis]|uniref:TROVE domain-containing protein n=1 Tax=Nocardia transvalensis TaxID=37333 RepID=UPI001894F0D4|nr:TROVE domain-containing protein [Nocardia transvalensis]MBF6328070.1 TROVE domain-containing protein [Nocardia transvalensis]
MDALAGINLRATAQSAQADPRQVRNTAGGFTFEVTPQQRLRRFLVLGTDGGTYYVGARDLTKDNAQVVLDFARNHTAELVDEVVAISTAGRAPRQNPALFALAAAASVGDQDGRRSALDALPLVARTGTQLFLFARYIEQFRGWGRGLRRAVGRWYTDKSIEDLSYQLVKYRQREGWSHRDLLRLSHTPGYTADDTRRRLYDWVCGRGGSLDGLRLVEGFQRAQAAAAGEIPQLVREYRLSWEMLPDAALDQAATWEALLDNGIPQTALLRQLPRLTRLGLLSPLAARTAAVAAQLADADRLRTARVHPVNLLVALRTYAAGRAARGDSAWEPSRPIVDALDAAFYAAFGAVEPTGKRYLLALDVSGSMTVPISGLPLTAREASAALALVTASTESSCEIVGFTSGGGGCHRHPAAALTPLSIGPRQRLADAIGAVSNLPFGGTDCALPMLYALQRKLDVDVFAVYTDNETWAGSVHPHQALQQYRREINPEAKLSVVAMTATDFTIADPADAGMLDVAGFDSAVPALLADFARGL